jgi:1-acyl-sn-glycerol-3-phosphate acyltransferase
MKTETVHVNTFYYLYFMLRKLSSLLLTCWGFKFTGEYASFPKRVMYIIMPHTSNWDFILGMLARSAMGLNLSFLAKDSLFKWPHGFFFRWLGGIPVDRSKKNNFVQSVVDSVAGYDELALAMLPEGTRKKTEKLKSGFYWIANNAKMDIVMVKFDFGNKEVNFSSPFTPSGDYDADLIKIRDFFKGTHGKIPEQGLWYDL